MQNLATLLTDFFIKKGIVPDNEREVYEYGFDITIYTIVSTVGLLIIGALMHRFWYAVIIISIFSIFQTTGGGYHANTHLKCFLTMVIILLASLVLTYIPEYSYIPEISSIISVILLLLVPLTLHPNKAYLASETPRLRRTSRITTLLISAISFILVYLVGLPIVPFALAFTMSAISRLYATWERRKSHA